MVASPSQHRTRFITLAGWGAAAIVLVAGVFAAWLAGQREMRLPKERPSSESKAAAESLMESTRNPNEVASVAAARKYAAYWSSPFEPSKAKPFDEPLLGVQIAGDTARVAFDDEAESEVLLEYDSLRKRWNGLRFSYTIKGAGRVSLPPRGY